MLLTECITSFGDLMFCHIICLVKNLVLNYNIWRNFFIFLVNFFIYSVKNAIFGVQFQNKGQGHLANFKFSFEKNLKN